MKTFSFLNFRFFVGMRIFFIYSGCLFMVTYSVAQNNKTYLETNVGLSYTDDVMEICPGFSVLYGHQKFVSETRFWDFQYGLAAPTIVTMKIGGGLKNINSGRSISGGVRIWPSHLYVQFGFPNKRCSNEVSKKMKKRLERRGSDRTHLLCGEWNMSLEAGLGNTDLWALSFSSIAIVTFSHRWYFE